MSSSSPKVCTAFQLFVIIPVTTANAERSFSKLKLIKTYLRKGTRKVTPLISSIHRTIHGTKFEL